MIPREFVRKIRRIEIITRRRADESFAGAYRSVFRGRGMEFDEVREYAWGDDVRAIDWNVTARTSVPHVKRFTEERELTVFLLVDVSASQGYGSRGQLKSDLAAEVAAVLAFSAIKNRDKVGALLFTDQVEKSVRPGAGRGHVLRVVREVLLHDPRGHGTDPVGALRYLGHILRRRAIVFVISDFLGPGFHPDRFGPELTLAARRHDLVAVRIGDPRERRLPRAGLMRMVDPESGREGVVDLGSKRVRAAFQDRARERDRALDQVVRSAGVDLVSLEAGQPYHRELGRFFRERKKRARG